MAPKWRRDASHAFKRDRVEECRPIWITSKLHNSRNHGPSLNKQSEIVCVSDKCRVKAESWFKDYFTVHIKADCKYQHKQVNNIIYQGLPCEISHCERERLVVNSGCGENIKSGFQKWPFLSLEMTLKVS